jgi:hypothetical protein
MGKIQMHRLRSMLRCATVAALGATALVAGFASPAQAVNSTRADLTSWTYTDSAQPSTPVQNPAGETPVGTFPDHHTRRAYFTFSRDRTGRRRSSAARRNSF